MNKFIILPLWFALWIPNVIVNDSKILPWQTIGGQWVCNYDSYANFHIQFDSLINIEGYLDTVYYPVDSFTH